MSRPAIHPYLPADLYKQFKKYVAAHGTTDSSVAETALKEFLGGTGDFKALTRRLDRIDRRIQRTQRNVELLADAFGRFVQMWLAYAPPMPEDAKDAAERQALRRYNQFMELVSADLAAGKSFVDDVAKDPVGDQDELAAAAERETE